jgi:hypothetical protein
MPHYFSKSKKGKNGKIIRRTKKIQKGGGSLKTKFKSLFESNPDECKQLNPKKIYPYKKLSTYINNISLINIELESTRKSIYRSYSKYPEKVKFTPDQLKKDLATEITNYDPKTQACPKKVTTKYTIDRMIYLKQLLSNNINIIYNSISETKNIREQTEMMEYIERILERVLGDQAPRVDSILRGKYKLLESIGKTVTREENKTNSAARTVNQQFDSCVSDMLSKFEGLGLNTKSNEHEQELEALITLAEFPDVPCLLPGAHKGGYKNRKRNRKTNRNRKYKKRSRKLGIYV